MKEYSFLNNPHDNDSERKTKEMPALTGKQKITLTLQPLPFKNPHHSERSKHELYQELAQLLPIIARLAEIYETGPSVEEDNDNLIISILLQRQESYSFKDKLLELLGTDISIVQNAFYDIEISEIDADENDSPSSET
jgi:hypothetical protein